MANDLTRSTSVLPILDLKRSFDDRLQKVSLTAEEAEVEQSKMGRKLIRDKAAGVFKVTDLINTIFKWREETEKALKSLKRDKLMENFFQLSEQNEAALSSLKNFMTSASGNVLFSKIVSIADENPPDVDLIECLAIVMYNVVVSDFEALFAEHRHALAQIGRVTAQAVAILSDGRSWPPFGLSSHATDDGIVTSEWNREFSAAYSKAKGVRDDKALIRIGHAIFELQTARLIIAAKDQKGGGFRCYYTAVGNEIRQYLQLSRE